MLNLDIPTGIIHQKFFIQTVNPLDVDSITTSRANFPSFDEVTFEQYEQIAPVSYQPPVGAPPQQPPVQPAYGEDSRRRDRRANEGSAVYATVWWDCWTNFRSLRGAIECRCQWVLSGTIKSLASLSPVIREDPLCRMNFPILVTDPNIHAYLKEIKSYIIGPTEHLPFVEAVKLADFI